MRAVFVSHFDFNLYRFRLPLMEELARQGARVFALCPDGDYAELIAKMGFQVVHIPFFRKSTNPVLESLTLARLTTAFMRIRPDLVHTFMHKPNIYGLLGASMAGKFGKRPALVASVTGLGSFYVEERSPSATRSVIDHLYRRALRVANKVIFYNEDDRALLVDRGVCPADRAVIIPGSGVDPERFTAHPRPARKEVTVCMVSRLVRDKGVMEFIEAARILRGRSSRRIRFLLAGDIDEGNPSSLSGVSLARLREEGAVELVGFQRDVETLLQEAEIFVLPSYREGMPVSILEAMSMELPVIAADAPGARSVVRHGETGLLVPVRSARALADAIELLAADPGMRSAMGRAGRVAVKARYSVRRIVEQHLAVYRSVVPDERSS